MSFFSSQVVFLTGSTGHLGVCLLYKLVLVLYVAEVFVLICGSEQQTISAWAELMPDHASSLLRTRKIRFIAGDMIQPNLGICRSDLEEISRVVTLVIHAAADISLKAPLREAILKNCLPPLELALLASKFQDLKCFV